jgi:excisionase family DNA binding protein
MSVNREKYGKVETPPLTTKLPLLDAAGVALALGTSTRHVQRLVTERRIPFVKVGRFVRFDPAELDVWLDAQRVATVPRPCRYDSAWR